jgi:hypothetical protein
MMSPATDNPANYAMRAVIHFLHAKSISVAEIHH